MISTAFDYQRANSLDEAIKKLQETGGRGKLLAGGHSLVPLMKLRMSEPGVLIDIAKIPGLSGIREKDGKIEIFAATVHHDVASSARAAPTSVRSWPRPPARSAIRRCETAARWAAASPTPIRRPTTRP